MVWERHARTRAVIRDAMEDAGFDNMAADTESTNDYYWHHWSHTIRAADRDALREADRAAAAIAAKHGVRYDEWR